MDIDLPLFAWKPVCSVVAFPLKKRIGKVRRVAGVFNEKSEKQRLWYWRTQVAQLSDQLQRIGYGEERIEEEIEAFRVAVSRELSMMNYQRLSRGNNPKGVA
ncbi:DUF6074 family protein [Rhizobium sp. TRM95796]|uniref:DUF6074 family protein n=1 Tax=Rhizobium sp. TRM95796 TaxID=2979862 RepID=UPI0021E842B1|nr:DUF6074 family protein [Rhizobium sp. TRM95796]MCV3764047.1 DUF6074 family protein [Rhizobium sp. TRM95796]